MSHKSQKIAEWTAGMQSGSLDSRYVAFFKLFNERQFFEAHEVLEDLWLQDRTSPNYHFYKGLIQLAGAFVHLQKRRLQPAQALFRLAADNFSRYPETHHQLRLGDLKQAISSWLKLAQGLEPGADALAVFPPPVIRLENDDPAEPNRANSEGG